MTIFFDFTNVLYNIFLLITIPFSKYFKKICILFIFIVKKNAEFWKICGKTENFKPAVTAAARGCRLTHLHRSRKDSRKKDFFGNSRFADGSHDKVKAFAWPSGKVGRKPWCGAKNLCGASIAAHGKTGREVYLSGRTNKSGHPVGCPLFLIKAVWNWCRVLLPLSCTADRGKASH